MQDNAIMMSSKGGIWIQGFGSYSKQKATTRDLGYKNKARGSLIGVDYKLRPDLFVGGSIGYGLSHVKWDEGVTKGHVKDYLTSLYSTWFQDKFYINASMTLAHNRFNVRRRITFATIDRTAHGRHTGYTFAPSLELGHRFTLMNGFDIVPFIRGNYVHVHEKGYQEKDAGALNLHIRSKTTTALRTEPGLNFYQHFKREDGLLTAKVKLSYVNKHPLKKGKITANLVGQPGSFLASGTNKTQHQVSPGLSLDYKATSGLFVSVAYDAQLGAKYKAHEVSIKIGHRF
jgi:fibronectin-binding autotransporter adhesin